jgi:transcriptional regulator with XRE-family HTH domain
MDKAQVVNAALLGDRLRRSRKARDMSQAELSTLLGLPQSWVSELETGKRPHLDANTLARFCTALGVSADYLLGLTDHPSAPGGPLAEYHRVDDKAPPRRTRQRKDSHRDA